MFPNVTDIFLKIYCAIVLVYTYVIFFFLLMSLNSSLVILRSRRYVKATLVFAAYRQKTSMPAKLANIELLKARHLHLQVLAFDDGLAEC